MMHAVHRIRKAWSVLVVELWEKMTDGQHIIVKKFLGEHIIVSLHCGKILGQHIMMMHGVHCEPMVSTLL
jgi:hypothetical protein